MDEDDDGGTRFQFQARFESPNVMGETKKKAETSSKPRAGGGDQEEKEEEGEGILLYSFPLFRPQDRGDRASSKPAFFQHLRKGGRDGWMDR